MITGCCLELEQIHPRKFCPPPPHEELARVTCDWRHTHKRMVWCILPTCCHQHHRDQHCGWLVVLPRRPMSPGQLVSPPSSFQARLNCHRIYSFLQASLWQTFSEPYVGSPLAVFCVVFIWRSARKHFLGQHLKLGRFHLKICISSL